MDSKASSPMLGYLKTELIMSDVQHIMSFQFVEVNEVMLNWLQMPKEQLIGRRYETLPVLLPINQIDWFSTSQTILDSRQPVQLQISSSVDDSYFRVDAFALDDCHLVFIFRHRNPVPHYAKVPFRRSHLLDLVDQSLPVALWLHNDQGELLYSNEWLHNRLVITPEVRQRALDTDHAAIEKGTTLVFDTPIDFQDGTHRTLRVYKQPLFDELTQQTYVLGVGFDFTRELQVAKELATSEEQFRFIAENASDVIWIFNVDQNKFTYFSPSVVTLRGYTVDESLSHTVRQLVTHESAEIVKQLMIQRSREFVKSGDAPLELVEVQFTTKSGRPVWTETSARIRRNKTGEMEVIGVSRNIEHRKRAEEQMNYMTHHDHLTDVFNRRYFESKSAELMVDAYLPLTLIVADLNGLKLANDAFGHQAGDQLLQRFADVLKANVRREDMVARIGGDEFAILLPQTNEKGAQYFLKRLKTTLADTQVGPLTLSASFGFVTATTLTASLSELYHEADEKMYLQKIIDGSRFKKELVYTIADYLFSKYPVEKLHGEKVAQWSALTAKALGLDPDVAKAIEKIAYYHDIGRVALPDKYNGEKMEPEDEDISAIRRLPEVGYHILKGSEEFAPYAEIVLYHHENMDGSGYPKGIKGEDIPLPSRILKITDMYDTMVRFEGFSVSETVRHLRSKRGTVYDDHVLDVFLSRVLNLVS